MKLDPQLEVECHNARMMVRNVMGNKYEQKIKDYKEILIAVQKKFNLPNVVMACSHCLTALDLPQNKQTDPEGWARAAFLSAMLDMVQPMSLTLNN